MILATLYRPIARALNARRRQSVTLDSLAHLDARLLRDVGLHVEAGAVRPLDPEAFAARVEVRELPLTGTPRVAGNRDEGGYCPHCGAALT